jgi:hypothetical protein
MFVFFTSQTCESFIELRAGLMKVYLFQCSLHHCRQSSSTLHQNVCYNPLNVVLSCLRLVIRVMVCSQAVFKRTKQVKSDVAGSGL